MRLLSGPAASPHDQEGVACVASKAIVLDEGLRSYVHAVLDENYRRAPPSDAIVFPVVERDGRFHVIAWFDEFEALLQAGAALVTIWRMAADPLSSLADYAVAFSIAPPEPDAEARQADGLCDRATVGMISSEERVSDRASIDAPPIGLRRA